MNRMLAWSKEVCLSLCSHVCGMSLGSRIILAEIRAASSDQYFRLIFSGRSASNTNKAGLVAIFYGSIVLIYRTCDESKIFERIVQWVSVDMVNLLRRAFPCHNSPSEAVRLIAAPFNEDVEITMRIYSASNIANPPSIAFSVFHFSREISGVWIVMEKILDFLFGGHICGQEGMCIRPMQFNANPR